MVDKSEKFSWFVRLGYMARGLTYMLLGYLALEISGGNAEGGSTGVFDMLQDVPLGTPLLWVIAIGMLAYALYKYLSAFANIYHRDDDVMGGLKRIGDLASGFAHTILAYAAYQFATGAKSSSGDGTQERAGTVLSYDLGGVVLGLVGVGFLVGAFIQGKKAWDLGFMKRISGSAPGWICHIGRAGHAARAVVFAVIGWSLMKAAWFSSSDQVKGLGQAITSLSDNGILYSLVAIGLIFFGLFSIVTSRYRIIPHLTKGDMKPDVPGKS